MSLSFWFELQVKKSFSELNKDEDVSYGPRVHSSSMSASEPHSVIFVVHGMGTGAVKECALEVQGKHPRVAKYEPESPLNFGCTVSYIK
jgi:hypothetical protein